MMGAGRLTNLTCEGVAMAEENGTTPLYPGDILDRETFDHLQLSAFFMMLVNESDAGESRAFELLRRLIENGLTATALKKGDPKPDDTDDAYCILPTT